MRTFRKRETLLLALICAVAVAARVGYGLAFDQFDAAPKWDARYYCDGARNILAGKGLTYDGVRPSTLWPPLSPAFLAGVFAVFGENYHAAMAAQIFLDVVTIVLMYLLALEIFDRRAALVAAAIAAVYPYFIYRSLILMTEPLATALLMALALVLLRMEKSFRPWHVAAAGVLAALLILCRANMQVLVLILPLWGFLVFKKRRLALARTAPVVAIALVLVAPYLVRNALIEGRFVGVSTTTGMTFYGAHNDLVFRDREFDGFWANIERLGEVAPIIDPSIKESDNSDRLMRLGLESVERNRGRMPMHLVCKMRNVWLIHTHYFFADGAAGMIPQLCYMALLPFFVVGVIANWRKRRAVFFYLMFGVVTITALIFYGNARMRAPVEPMMIILAAGGLVIAAQKIRGIFRGDRASVEIAPEKAEAVCTGCASELRHRVCCGT